MAKLIKHDHRATPALWPQPENESMLMKNLQSSLQFQNFVALIVVISAGAAAEVTGSNAAPAWQLGCIPMELTKVSAAAEDGGTNSIEFNLRLLIEREVPFSLREED